MKRLFGFFTSPHHNRTHTVHPKRRLCRLESLERRDLLSAVPLSASEYAALTAQYSSLSLPETMDDLNVITLDLSEGNGLADLQTAIVKAAHTYASDLIVVRTTADANRLSAPESLHINIDSNVFGSLTIVGLGDTPLTLAGRLRNHGIEVEGNNTNVGFANLTITTCTYGIQVLNHAAVAIADCEITDCVDGIWNNYGTTTITDCVITGNSDNGIYSWSGTTTITDCIITGNTNSGIYYSSSKLTIINTQITNNTASQVGGGIYVKKSTVNVMNSLIANNTADYYGAGIFNESGTVKITNSTITGNTTKVEGSGGIRNNTSSGKVELYNTIVVGNTGDISGWVSGSNNLTTSAQWQSGENNLTYDAALPLFKDEENGDYSLAEGSQAADRGNDELAELAGLDELAKDLAGNVRFQNDSIDIGAFESGDAKIQFPPTVTLEKIPALTANASITLTWKAEDADSDLAFCEVWVSKDSAEFVKVAENVTNGKYVFAFDGDGQYSFKVTAVDEAGNRAESEVRECVFDATAPTVILGEVPAQTNAESVTLSWTADCAEFCEVWVSKDGAEFVKAAENLTDGTFTFVFDGDGQYTFKVAAVDMAGNRAESEVVSVEKWTEPEPSVSAEVSGNRVKVTWMNDGPEADSVRYREAGTQRWTVRKLKAGVSEFSFNGRAGKSYEIQVLCGQQEDRVLTESVTLLVSPKMKADRNSVTDESFAVNVTNWAGQLHECASIVRVTLNGERQEITLEDGHGSCVFSGGESAEFADGTLRFGNVKSNFQHTVRVAFSDGESTSAESSPLRVRTVMAAYDAPVIESAEALDGKSVCVTWTTAYGKNSTQAAKYYTVQYSTDGERWRTATTRAEGNAFILTNLKGKTQYLVSVFATRDRDFSASVPSESVIVKTAFPTPTIISVRSTLTGRAVVSWKSESGAAQYELAWRETGASEWQNVQISSSDSKVTFTLFGLNSGKGCEFRVRALPLDPTVNTSGWSDIKSVKKVS